MRKSFTVGKVMLSASFSASLIACILTFVLALPEFRAHGLSEVTFYPYYVFGVLMILVILDAVTAYFWWKETREEEQTISQLEDQLEENAQKQLRGQRVPLIIYNLEALVGAAPEYLPIIERLFCTFPGIKGIELTSLRGGYSGSSTFKVYIKDQDNRRKGPYVLKLGKKQEIEGEEDRYRTCVLGTIANHHNIYSCELETPGEYAGVTYDFVGIGGKVQNFQEFYKHGDITKITGAIQRLYESMKRGKEKEQRVWHGDTTMYLYNLYEEYYLPDDKRGDISHHIWEVTDGYLQIHPGKPTLNLPDNLRAAFPDDSNVFWCNPIHFIRDWDNKKLEVSFYKCTIHGDLNSRNIIIEERGEEFIPWLIDFSHTGNGLSATRTEEAIKRYSQMEKDKGHVLRDFCQLEADIKFCLTELYSEDDLIQALLFEQELMNHRLRLDPDKQSHPEVFNDGRFRKAWECIKDIRHLAEEHLSQPGEVRPYYLSLLHATLPIVYYSSEQFANKNCEDWQKRYALLSAAMLCSQLL